MREEGNGTIPIGKAGGNSPDVTGILEERRCRTGYGRCGKRKD